MWFTFNNNETLFTTYVMGVGIAHGLCGVLLPFFEKSWIAIWLALVTFATGVIFCFGMKPASRSTNAYGNFLGLAALIDAGHVVSSILLLVTNFPGEQRIQSPLTVLIFIVLAIMSMHLHFWHKYGIWEDKEPDPIPFQDVNKWRPYLYLSIMAPISSLVYGMSEFRLVGTQSSLVVMEGAIGIITAMVLFSMLCRRFRRSFRGCVSLMVWTGVTVLDFVCAAFLYGLIAKTRILRIQHGVSLITTLILLCTCFLSITLKTCILEEPIMFRRGAETEMVSTSRMMTKLRHTSLKNQQNEPTFSTVDRQHSAVQTTLQHQNSSQIV